MVTSFQMPHLGNKYVIACTDPHIFTLPLFVLHSEFPCHLLLLPPPPLLPSPWSARITAAHDGLDWTQSRMWHSEAESLNFSLFACVCCLGASCAGVCSPPAPTAVGEEETTVSVSYVVSPSLFLLLSFSCSFSFIATAIRIHPSFLAIIPLGYAMHSPPMVTNWCWRPTVTLLSLVVSADS